MVPTRGFTDKSQNNILVNLVSKCCDRHLRMPQTIHPPSEFVNTTCRVPGSSFTDAATKDRAPIRTHRMICTISQPETKELLLMRWVLGFWMAGGLVNGRRQHSQHGTPIAGISPHVHPLRARLRVVRSVVYSMLIPDGCWHRCSMKSR